MDKKENNIEDTVADFEKIHPDVFGTKYEDDGRITMHMFIDYHDLEKIYRDLLDGGFLMNFGKCVMLFASLEYVIAYNVSLLNACALSSTEINKKDKDENFTRNFAANITESFSKLVKKLRMVYKIYQDS